MSDGWLGFFGGILAALVGGLIGQHCAATQPGPSKAKRKLNLDAYFHLLDLKNWYFWVATAELHGEEPKPEVLYNCRKLALQLNDKLRAFDRVDQLDEILILFSESTSTANERARRLDELIDQYGKLVTPKYSTIINRISRANILRHRPGASPPINAPGSWRYVK
jgi:hypothetical protein